MYLSPSFFPTEDWTEKNTFHRENQTSPTKTDQACSVRKSGNFLVLLFPFSRGEEKWIWEFLLEGGGRGGVAHLANFRRHQHG